MRKRISFVVSLLFAVSSIQAIDVVFRMDDYQLNDDSLNLAILEEFEKVKIPLSIGIVPCDGDESFVCQQSPLVEKMKSMAANGQIEIVLHGLTHVYSAIGEFDGYDYEEQLRRIKKGKTFLDSVFEKNIEGFIPPRNAYNKATLKALEQCDFVYLSNDTWGIGCTDSEFFPTNNSLLYYPESSSKAWELSNNELIPALLKLLYRMNEQNGLIIVMLHPFDITPTFTVEDLRICLHDIATIPNVHCYTFNEIYQKWSGEASFINANRIERNIISKYFYHPLALWSENTIIWACILDILVFVLLNVLCCVFAMFITFYCLKWLSCLFNNNLTFKWKINDKTFVLFGIILCCIAILTGFWTWYRLFDLGWLSFLCLMVFVSTLFSSLIAYWQIKHNLN